MTDLPDLSDIALDIPRPLSDVERVARLRAGRVAAGLTVNGTVRRKRPNGSWPSILEHAKGIVESYDTPVTLRQLFYRLVSDGTLRNDEKGVDYSMLSKQTGIARREGWFPALAEAGRPIINVPSWESPEDAVASLVRQYRRDRTEGQEYDLYLVVEKAGMLAQLQSWFGALGIPILATEGWSSVTLDQNLETQYSTRRPPVLIYAGDCDASGEAISEGLAVNHPGATIDRVALSEEQVERYGFERRPAKPKDPNAPAFIARHGALWQVELDALDPNDLRALYQAAIDRYWDPDAYDAVMAREAEDIEDLEGWEPAE